MDRTLVAATLVFAACSRPGAGDAGTPTCLAFDQVQSAVVLVTDAPHPVPLVRTTRAQTRFCVDEHSFSLARLDAPGKGKVAGEADGGMSLRADLGGVYALVDDTKPFEAVSRPLYFARSAPAAEQVWPRYCEEVHQLSATLWACDGALFSGSAALSVPETERWLAREDGGALAARKDGIYALSSEELDTDAGVWVAPFMAIDGWDVDPSGLSLATDSGFFECRVGQPTCESLGPRFGTGDLPLAQQRLVALMRRDGRTLFSVAPAQHPFCEAKAAVQQCETTLLGPIIAANGNTGWALSTLFTEGGGLGLRALAWDAGWAETGASFTGPRDFVVQAGARAVTPTRVVFARDRQVLLWRWDSTGDLFELIEVPDAGTRIAAGAGEGFYWLAVGGASPTTSVFLSP